MVALWRGGAAVRCWRWRLLSSGSACLPPGLLGLGPERRAGGPGLAEAIWTTLRENGADQEGRVDELTALLETRADVGLIGRLALGRHWNRLPEAQRQEYEELFRAVVIRSLARRLDGYAVGAEGALEERFRILGQGPRASATRWSAPRCFPTNGSRWRWTGACARATPDR